MFQSYIIEERSYVSFVKREIHNLVRPHFGEQRTGEIDIVASEAASNLIKFAGRGELLYRLSTEHEQAVFELICIDSGKGIKDVPHSIKDGISTMNTLGHGLGSIMRLSNFAEIYSLPDWGTIVYAKFYREPDFRPPRAHVQVRCLNLAKPGEKVSGDGMALKLLDHKTLLMVGDGLGHGPQAKEAIDRAAEVFDASMYADPSELLRELNTGVKKTRGLVSTIVAIDHKQKQILVCGVGNIYTRLQCGLEFKNYIANNGIIGLNIPGRIESSVYKLEKMHQVIMCSDGIKTKWDLVRYPNILKHDPMILAAVLYKDQARRSDDMTIVTVKVS